MFIRGIKIPSYLEGRHLSFYSFCAIRGTKGSEVWIEGFFKMPHPPERPRRWAIFIKMPAGIPSSAHPARSCPCSYRCFFFLLCYSAHITGRFSFWQDFFSSFSWTLPSVFFFAFVVFSSLLLPSACIILSTIAVYIGANSSPQQTFGIDREAAKIRVSKNSKTLAYSSCLRKSMLLRLKRDFRLRVALFVIAKRHFFFFFLRFLIYLYV